MSRSADLARLILERQLAHQEQVQCVTCGTTEVVVGYELPEIWRPVPPDDGGFYVCSDVCERRWQHQGPVVDSEPFEWADLDED
jgi:hypothetical protein